MVERLVVSVAVRAVVTVGDLFWSAVLWVVIMGRIVSIESIMGVVVCVYLKVGVSKYFNGLLVTLIVL